MSNHNHISEEKNFQLHYMVTDSFGLSINSSNIIKDLRNIEGLVDFSNLNEDHEGFSNKT